MKSTFRKRMLRTTGAVAGALETSVARDFSSAGSTFNASGKNR